MIKNALGSAKSVGPGCPSHAKQKKLLEASRALSDCRVSGTTVMPLLPPACKFTQRLNRVDGEWLHEGNVTLIEGVRRAVCEHQGDVLVKGSESVLKLMDPWRTVCEEFTYEQSIKRGSGDGAYIRGYMGGYMGPVNLQSNEERY